MTEDLKGFFQEFLDERFKQIDLKIQDLQKQLFENIREQEISLIDQIAKVLKNQQDLQREFDSLLKEIKVAQIQADEIIKNFSLEIPKPQQQQCLPIQQDFQQHLFNLYSPTIDLSDQKKCISFNDYSHQQSNILKQNKETQQFTNPLVSKFDQGQKTVYITKTGVKYHNSFCKSLQGSKIPTTLNVAIKQGFSACKLC
ncbi:unnamed protein product [Paramecium octaurelia]|uniref:Uncharacterized protein n=1 Tax=Paramecium octaurelia TaxID=43137 RepID=A0A8S1XBX5_PAROT|nr:unnamed protein product [Paramecium octaurelia]